MANDVARNRAYVLILVLVLGFLLTIVAVGIFFVFFRSTPEAASSTIITPQNGAQIVFGGPVQVQSRHTGSDPARVELRVIGATAATSTLIGANAPSQGIVLQQWTPDQTGLFTVQVIALDDENQTLSSGTIQVEVIDNTIVSIAPQQPQFAGVFQSPTATPPVQAPPTEIPQAGITPPSPPGVTVVPLTTTVEASPTPVLIFPPPPPVPGVPKGPIQEQLPELMPPVCDAAKYLGPFVPSTRQRITITEPDPVPAKTVGGTLVHRAWRLQNIGTCTWGPGYELAFYGGRSMGSGGIAFEATYPSEPARRNTVSNSDRLIVPEGQPNQVAVLEVLLQTPVTPGIHQSYWRMRNPQGVYFGPIIGVTLDIVRDCEFGIYGAPVINKFEIVGVGPVFEPDNPVNVTAELGQPVTLEWSIINAESYDIVITDPIGNTTNLATSNPADRKSFIPDRLGDYTITLFADNGSCTASASVTVKVIPPEGEQFVLSITSANPAAAGGADASLKYSPALTPGSIVAEWRHFDTDVDEVILFSSIYERQLEPECTPVYGGLVLRCVFSGWRPLGNEPALLEGNAGAAAVSNVKGPLAIQSLPRSTPITDSTTERFAFFYVAQASQAGTLDPVQPCSNTVTETLRLDPAVPLTDLPIELSPSSLEASGQVLPSARIPPCVVETGAQVVFQPNLSFLEQLDQCVIIIGDTCLSWQQIILGGLAILIIILIIRAIFR